MDVSAFSISRHLSDLVGRHVDVKVADSPKFSENIRTACYTVDPNAGTAVVQLDFHLLAALGGTMIGFPPMEIEQQVKTGKLDENMTDATRELMNVLAAVIVSEGRAVFKGLFAKASDYSGRAMEIVSGNYFPLKLLVTPAGGKAGYMTIVCDLV